MEPEKKLTGALSQPVTASTVDKCCFTTNCFILAKRSRPSSFSVDLFQSPLNYWVHKLNLKRLFVKKIRAMIIGSWYQGSAVA